MHATTVKNKITQRDNYKEIMSVIVVILLLTLTLIAIFRQLISWVFQKWVALQEILHFIVNSLQD